jgi:hypothetical protein
MRAVLDSNLSWDPDYPYVLQNLSQSLEANSV